MSDNAEVMQQKESKTSKKEEHLKTYRIHPTYYSDLDYDTRTISYEVHLPGVDKENVSLKVLPDLWNMEATRKEKKSQAFYTLSRYFPYEVDPNSVKASYEHGLLKFTVTLKDPLADAVDIKLE
jgi:HSP20 family protein